eukprot:437469_1
MSGRSKLMATETLLPGSTTDDIIIIDTNYVSELHSDLINTGKSCGDERQLVQVLGGIDEILQHYLQQQLLNPTQLQSIHSILTANTTNACTTVNAMESLSVDMDGVDHHLPIFGTIVLNTKNTFLHQLCSAHQAEQILNILYHKLTVSSVVITLLYHNICVAIEYFSTIPWFDSVGYLVSELMADVIAVSYIICIMLSVNKTAIKFTLSTFEFWLKFLTAIVLGTCTYLYDALDPDVSVLQKLVHRACFTEVWVAVTLYSVMDGLNIKPGIKAILAIGFACYISVFALYYTLFEQTDQMITLWDGCAISLLHMIASTNRILSIFLWRQAILFIWKKDKATIISTWIDIKWVTSNTNRIYNISS